MSRSISAAACRHVSPIESPAARLLWLWFVLAVTAVIGVTRGAAQDDSPLDDDGNLVRFGRDIAPILLNRCLECHGPDDAKNDFRVDDPDSMSFYIEPGDWELSDLFTEYLATDDEDMLMPPPSHGGPLSAAELALVRVWIDEGAVWPEGYQLLAVDHSELAPVEAAPRRRELTFAQRIWAFQGYFHPATVHFPIALLLVGALFVVLGFFVPSLGNQMPLACLLLGAVTAVAATSMGWAFATEQGYGSWRKFDLDSEIFWHRWSGLIVSVLASILAIVALVAVWRDRPKLHRVWKIGLLVVAAMVGMVGHQGGELTYGSDLYPKAFRILLGEGQADTPSPEEAAETEEAEAEAGSSAEPSPD